MLIRSLFSALTLASLLMLSAQTMSAEQAKSAANQPGAEQLLQEPVAGYVIGGTGNRQPIRNPYEGSKDALAQGRVLFDAMNCSGCHAADAGGGMGPPLGDKDWIYGSSPADIYLTITQGRPNGMPSFQNIGSDSIWKLVTYVRSLSYERH